MIRHALVLAPCLLAAPAHAERVDGWTLAAPTFDHARMDTLDARVADDTYKQINSVIVIRDGRLLIERYYNGADRDTPHNPRSVGKTFTSTVLGLALRDGYIGSLDQTLADFYDLSDYAHPDVRKGRVTLRQLITMTSGFDGFDFDPDSPGNEENMYPQPDWVRWTLDLPMAADRDPGDAWRYFTAGIVVLGDILNRRVPGGLEAYAHQQLFAPLGISNYAWQHTPQMVANTAGGIALTPLDFAKFGQLYKNHGVWNGTQVLPAAWVDASLAKHASTTNEGVGYGYLWWKQRYVVKGRSIAVTLCSGNGGNKIIVFDDMPIVVVVTASAYGKPYMHKQVDDLLVRYVIPAVLR